MRRVVGAVFVSIALAGCAAQGPDRPSARLPAAPSATSVVDCGSFDLGQGEELPDSAVRCFVEAVARSHPARLAQTRLTVEGDPIPITYVADAGGDVEVVHDSRQDRFGSGKVERQTCVGPSPAPGGLEFARCR